MEYTMIYKWAPKFPSRGVDAQVAGEYLDGLRQRVSLTPATVLNEAKQASCPLHPIFEWDNDVAAEAYRNQQAGSVLRAIHVIVDKEGEQSACVRAFVTLRDSDHKGQTQNYESIVDVANDPVKRELMLKRALTELNQWRQRYADLQEFTKLFGFVDQLLVHIEKQVQQVQVVEMRA